MSEASPQSGFIIDPAPVAWPVVVEGIPADGGNFASFQFTAYLRVVSEEEIKGIVKDSSDDAELEAILAENARLLPKLVAGWDDVRRADGSAVPFTPEALVAQLTGRYGRQLGAGLWRAVHEVRYGVRLGNSASAPAAGSASAELAAPTSSSPT